MEVPGSEWVKKRKGGRGSALLLPIYNLNLWRAWQPPNASCVRSMCTLEYLSLFHLPLPAAFLSIRPPARTVRPIHSLFVCVRNTHRSLVIYPPTSNKLSCHGSVPSPRERMISSWVRFFIGAAPLLLLSELPPCQTLLMRPRIESIASEQRE